MRLERASYKAIKYACVNFHYSKSAPSVGRAYSVFNKDGDWCGVICYGRGATKDIGNPYGLNPGECIELQRIALNGKQTNVSKALAVSLKLIKRDAPLARMVVSYADPEQGHLGIIYQASNWFYVGVTLSAKEYVVNGRRMHGRTYRSLGKPNGAVEINGSSKIRYIYPLDKSLISMCQSLAKPYPKKHAAVAQGSASNNQLEGGVRNDPAAQKVT